MKANWARAKKFFNYKRPRSKRYGKDAAKRLTQTGWRRYKRMNSVMHYRKTKMA